MAEKSVSRRAALAQTATVVAAATGGSLAIAGSAAASGKKNRASRAQGAPRYRFQPVVPAGERHVYDQYRIASGGRLGPFFVASGVLGIRDDFSIPADLEEQFEVLFSNMRRLLRQAGLDYENVYDILSFHIDLDDIATFKKVKDKYIRKPYPCWTAIGAAQVGGRSMPGMRAEVKVWAYDS